MLSRLIAVLLVLGTVPIGFAPLTATAAVAYLVCYSGFELIVLAALFDGYHGGFMSVPYVTLWTTGLVVAAEWLRPRLVLYTRE